MTPPPVFPAVQRKFDVIYMALNRVNCETVWCIVLHVYADEKDLKILLPELPVTVNLFVLKSKRLGNITTARPYRVILYSSKLLASGFTELTLIPNNLNQK